MKIFAEIITVGDELLIGQVVDTNSAWIGKELNKIGVNVKQITSVRDQAEEITEAIDNALKRVDIVLMTGGLGPTKDDITKVTLCEYFNTELVFDAEVFKNVERILAGKIPMNKLNRGLAYVPKGCTVIPNSVGSASISWFDHQGKVLVSMPGVPQEMKAAMSESILPRLSEKFETDFILHKTYYVKNYAESVLAEKLNDWEESIPSTFSLAYLPQSGIMRLRLSGEGSDYEKLQEQLLEIERGLYNELEGDVFAEDDRPLEEQLGGWLIEKGFTISTAESCTGGKMAARLTEKSGASAYFQGGIVAYANEVKMNQLGVAEQTLIDHGSVSEETAIEMVKGVAKLLNTDCALATTGIAGPTGAVPGKPVGTVWIAVWCAGKLRTRKLEYNHGRELNIERSCNHAFFMLMEMLQELEKC